jgi:hypothetical protein
MYVHRFYVSHTINYLNLNKISLYSSKINNKYKIKITIYNNILVYNNIYKIYYITIKQRVTVTVAIMVKLKIKNTTNTCSYINLFS